MNKRLSFTKLEVKLVFCLIFALSISVGIFFLLDYVGEGLLDSHFNNTSFAKSQKYRIIDDFKNYVKKNKVSIKDNAKITNWMEKEKYITVYIYKDNKVVYSYDKNSLEETPEYLKDLSLGDRPLYDITFKDAKAKLYLNSFFEYKYYYTMSFLCIVFSFFCFIGIILYFIKMKTSYIRKLENEIKILEGGDLNYPISIEGNDELTSLALSINEMRQSFTERLEVEEKATFANKELITSLSHDLRTPLTALLGYFDIIELKKYNNEDTLMRYIHNSREKAYQIKHLSDKLFEYFTVFSTNEDNLDFEVFDGIQLIDQLIDEQLFVLENNGFSYELTPCNMPFNIKADLFSMRRVFDNVFSNITKYADKSMPIIIKYYVKSKFVFICIENHIDKYKPAVNSTGIGMKTCEKIIEQHNGYVTVNKTEDTFSCHICIEITNSDTI